MNDEQNNWKKDDSVCDLKSILKTISETQDKAKLPIFKGVFHETAPFILYSIESLEPYLAFGNAPTSQTFFKTCFFRLEKINNSSIHLSLLYPTNVEGNYFGDIGMPYRLKETNCTVIVALENFCGIQFVSPKLMNRQIIVSGQKW